MRIKKVSFTFYINKIADREQTVTFKHPYELIHPSHLKMWLGQVFPGDTYLWSTSWTHLVVRIGRFEAILDQNDRDEVVNGAHLPCEGLQRSSETGNADVFEALENGAKAIATECMETLSARAMRRQKPEPRVARGSGRGH